MFQTSFSHWAWARLSVTLHGNAGVAKHRRQFVGAWLGRALKLAEHDLSVCHVMDDARFDAIEADEAKAAEDLFRREQAGPVVPRCPGRFGA